MTRLIQLEARARNFSFAAKGNVTVLWSVRTGKYFYKVGEHWASRDEAQKALK